MQRGINLVGDRSKPAAETIIGLINLDKLIKSKQESDYSPKKDITNIK